MFYQNRNINIQIEKVLTKFVDVCLFFYCCGTENLNQEYAAWT